MEEPKWPDGITVRDFEPGIDDAAWLQVNNRAFENHPEQGAWIKTTLERRLAEDWFDPSLFVLAFDDDDDNDDNDDADLAGFNWCKQHPAAGNAPPLGEIFVIGVDPRAPVAASAVRSRSKVSRACTLAVPRPVRCSPTPTTPGRSACTRASASRVHRVDRSYARDVAAR